MTPQRMAVSFLAPLLFVFNSCQSPVAQAPDDAEVVDAYYNYLWRTADSADIRVYEDLIRIGDSGVGSRTTKGILVDGSAFQEWAALAQGKHKLVRDRPGIPFNHGSGTWIELRRQGQPIGIVEYKYDAVRLGHTRDFEVKYEDGDFLARLQEIVDRWRQSHPESITEHED